METFVNDITAQSSHRWLKRKETINNRNQSEEEITSAKQHELIDEIHRCLDLKDDEALEKLIDAWAEKHIILLPHAVSCEAMEFASSVGNFQLSQKLLNHLKTHDSEFYTENLNYFNFVALELDFRTSNSNRTTIDDLLEKFEGLYKTSIADEKNTKQIMRFCSVIIEDCVAKRGASGAIKLKDKIEGMCDNSKDYRLLFELWRRLFER